MCVCVSVCGCSWMNVGALNGVVEVCIEAFRFHNVEICGLYHDMNFSGRCTCTVNVYG